MGQSPKRRQLSVNIIFTVRTLETEANKAYMRKFLGKEFTAKIDALQLECLEKNAKYAGEQRWHEMHTYANAFAALDDILAIVKKSDAYLSRPMPRGYDRSGVAFY
jgi:hypothetical protein